MVIDHKKRFKKLAAEIDLNTLNCFLLKKIDKVHQRCDSRLIASLSLSFSFFSFLFQLLTHNIWIDLGRQTLRRRPRPIILAKLLLGAPNAQVMTATVQKRWGVFCCSRWVLHIGNTYFRPFVSATEVDRNCLFSEFTPRNSR